MADKLLDIIKTINNHCVICIEIIQHKAVFQISESN